MTCGWGSLAPSNSTYEFCLYDNLGRGWENSFLGYAATAADALNWEFHSTSFSGMGMVRNNGSPNTTAAYTMPKFFL